MLLDHLFLDEKYWFVPLVLQAIAYVGVLKKMGIGWLWAFIPGGADYQLTRKLYPRTRTFWRPFFVMMLLVCAAMYLDPFSGSGRPTARIFLHIAIFVYEVFLFRLYLRLSTAFGKKWPFAVLTILLPPLGLGILGYGKAEYRGDPTFKLAQPGPILGFLIRLGFIAISGAEALAIIAVVGFFTVRAYPPRFIAEALLSDTLKDTADVTGTGRVVTREEAMGDAAAQIATMPTSREKFFPDHSQDKSVVVIEYVIGSDLEDRAGLSSANIAQMVEATKRGSALTFVLETGGSKRWFTKGIDDETYGRYIVRDGKIEKVQELDRKTCMSEPQELADFLNWAKQNYPADRYMLAFWDHGGGLSMGYGMDALNKREADLPTLSVSEIADAIAQSGMKFDVIGFDACLMQDIEVAAALEPYADYYLASQEVEGGYGWSYNSAFGTLAENPGMSSEDFGCEMVACYDPYNTIIKGGEPDTMATLSFVDLPLAKAAYQRLEGLFGQAREAVHANSSSFVDLSLAGTKAYTFSNSEQVDLIDFLGHLNLLDYENVICSEEELEALTNAVKACVLYRNGDSAEGVNGMALTFPVQTIETYAYDSKQLDHFSFASQKALYSDFFSIMAVQKKKENEAFDEENASFLETVSHYLQKDYTQEEWYVQGFENYETQPTLIDIPLTEVEGGYQIQLPDRAWDIIAYSDQIVYQKTDDGLLRYLGIDSIGATDENGHPMVAMEGTWVHVADRLVCYEGTGARVTEQGTVFTGTVKARLNGTVTAYLSVEWDPVAEGDEGPVMGHIVGYTSPELDQLSDFVESLDENGLLTGFMSKGLMQLQPGDRVEFLFDYYDEQGNLVKTEPYGRTMTVTNAGRIDVTDEPLEPCDIVFGGVLTDAYQRVMSTEKIEAHVG